MLILAKIINLPLKNINLPLKNINIPFLTLKLLFFLCCFLLWFFVAVLILVPNFALFYFCHPTYHFFRCYTLSVH